MTVRFDTTEYQFSHGRKPRGTGCWAFKNKYRNDPPVFAPGTMTLADAKKWAAKALVDQLTSPSMANTLVIEVCP